MCTMVSTDNVRRSVRLLILVTTARHGSLGWFPPRWRRCARGDYRDDNESTLELMLTFCVQTNQFMFDLPYDIMAIGK